MTDEGGFLGVSRSLTGRRWRARPADENLVQAHRRALALEEPLARAMASRGVALEDGERFLRPTLKGLFPDPSCFADMALAARLLVDAVESKRKLAVFADYDVDGATSAALLVRWFRHLGRDLPIVVPDRVTEGYGPSPAAFRRLREEGVELVVTVDCGAAAHEALHEAKRIGLEVIVVDHHLMRGEPPPAAALVNPNRPDCVSGQGVLAAAGVTFVLLAALNREARARGLFRDLSEPDLIAWLDLAALGAICDVTRLVGFNRAIAAQGLRVMGRWGNPGLAALRRAAGSSCISPGVFEAGFLLGPRINAGGRIGRSDLGARLLSTDDPAEADAIAAELHGLNAERRAVEDGVLAEAKSALDTGNLDPTASAIVVAGEDWHPGVIGIVASRLREAHRRPVIVIGIDRAGGVAKGSGRSQPGVNLGAAVQAAFEEGLLLAGGGHAMAAGLTIRPEAIPEFRAFLCERLSGEMAEASADDALDVDALASAGSAPGLRALFSSLEPFGPGNPEPTVALADAQVEAPAPVRGGHVRLTLRDASGSRLRAIAWRAGETPLGRALLTGGGSLHVAGVLKPDAYAGPGKVQLEITDAADPRMR